jgi:hypothetical protein
MSRTLYVVVSNKRGVLYRGGNLIKSDASIRSGVKYDEGENMVGSSSQSMIDIQGEERTGYVLERGHDRLSIKMQNKDKLVDITLQDESAIQALKGFI